MIEEFLSVIRVIIFNITIKFNNKKVDVGEGLKLYCKFKIKGKGRVNIGKNCTIIGVLGDKSQFVTIDARNISSVVNIGDNAIICGSRISSSYEITIGNDFSIEESGISDSDYHSIDKNRSHPHHENTDKCKIIIGDRVCIGSRCFITKGVNIGDDVKILPGSIVPNSVKSNSIVIGNPAKEQNNKS